jgi:hypothetical protein
MFALGDIPSLFNVSPVGQRIVADLIARFEAPTMPPAVPRKGACALLGDIGSTKEIQLEQAGEIDSFLNGSVRHVTTGSILRYLIRRVILSHPADAPVAKVRKPKGMFKAKPAFKAPRPRTEAELEGLRKGNAKRRLEAQTRRLKEGAANTA